MLSSPLRAEVECSAGMVFVCEILERYSINASSAMTFSPLLLEINFFFQLAKDLVHHCRQV